MDAKQHAVHRTILAVDVEGFGDQRKVTPHQVAIRNGLYESLRRAFHEAGIPWTVAYREDRGDGCLILAPPEVPKVLFTDALPARLALALREHNAGHRPEQQIRLRISMHAGEVRYDDYGVTSTSINLAFRLLDAPQLKAALAMSPGVLALIASSWFFDEVVRHGTVVDPATYRRVLVVVKETTAVAWISIPDRPYSAANPIPDDHPGRPAASGGPLTLIDIDDLDRMDNLLRILRGIGEQNAVNASAARAAARHDPVGPVVLDEASSSSPVSRWPARRPRGVSPITARLGRCGWPSPRSGRSVRK